MNIYIYIFLDSSLYIYVSIHIYRFISLYVYVYLSLSLYIYIYESTCCFLGATSMSFGGPLGLLRGLKWRIRYTKPYINPSTQDGRCWEIIAPICTVWVSCWKLYMYLYDAMQAQDPTRNHTSRSGGSGLFRTIPGLFRDYSGKGLQNVENIRGEGA